MHPRTRLNSPRPKVLLIPEGGLYLAFRLPPLFRKAGWDVDLLCQSGDPLVHSRHVGAAWQEKTCEDISVRLEKILRDPQRPWPAVIVAHEKIARRMFATGDADLLRNWQPGAMDPQVREFLLSKFGLQAAYEKGHLPVPPCRVCHTQTELAVFAGDVGWPIIVKPASEAGGAGVARFNSPAELESGCSQIIFPMLAQQYIRGRRGVVDMLCSAGRALAWLSSYSTKRTGGEFGPSSARQFHPMPELQPLVEQIAQAVKFEGFCGFDWIKEEGTGRIYLIEFHPRPSSGFRFSRFCGVDFSPAITAWLQRDVESYPTQVQPPGSPVAAHYFSCDLFRCLRQRDWPGLKPWLPGSGACHDVFWDDAPLLAAWVVQRGRRWFRSRFPAR